MIQIQGRVICDSQPVVGAEVRIEGHDLCRSVLTDANGEFIHGVGGRRVERNLGIQIRVSADGYTSVTAHLSGVTDKGKEWPYLIFNLDSVFEN